jgi:hypothetical protein
VNTRLKICTLVLTLAAASMLLAASPAAAGCGCNKPPPPPGQVRPGVTYAGSTVTLFSPSFVPQRSYRVTFTSGVTGQRASVDAQAVVGRDLADAVTKPLLRVSLPALPLGPASITVTSSGTTVLSVKDSSFTVAAAPVALPQDYGVYRWKGYQAAVGRDGVAYIALDLSGMTKPMVFEAYAAGYPLRFSIEDVLFLNTQGFLMQLLVSDVTRPDSSAIPGMYVVNAAAGALDSDRLHYSRHEFSTYFLQHYERQPHAVDPSDPSWHVDGTRHVDHDHLILAIDGRLAGLVAPPPGATPAFDLVVGIYSLFNNGVVGRDSVTLRGAASVDSYDTDTGEFSDGGDVFSNGTVAIEDDALIDGSVTAAGVMVDDRATISGDEILSRVKQTFMAVSVPAGIQDLGDVRLPAGSSMTVHGPGSFRMHDATSDGGATLFVDNVAGPVTLYVTGKVRLRGGTKITIADPDPERFAIYVSGPGPVEIEGKNKASTLVSGVVYAPDAAVRLSGDGEFLGAFVGKTLEMRDTSQVHYDASLRRPVE